MTPHARHATFLLLALAATALAGCAGGKQAAQDDGLQGKTESRIVDGEESPAEGTGSIRGRVVDDLGLPVADASVSLLSTPYSTVTAADGAFGFSNVTPGKLTLRVVSGTYRAHEGAIDVAADRVTEVTVTLVPRDARGPGYRPHLHDYWGTATEVTLMDDPVHWKKLGVYAQSYGAAGEVITGYGMANSATFWGVFEVPDQGNGLPPIVLPGTASLKVSMRWGDDVDADAFLLRYTTAKDAILQTLDPITNGGERIITLGEGDADNGHQMFSLWDFAMRPAPRTAPVTVDGPIHVTMTLVKGGVPVEPPHEDFWNGTDTYESRSANSTWSYTGSTIGGCGDYNFIKTLDPGRLVPPGTNRLTMRFAWWSTDPQLNGTAADGTFRLSWKPANLPGSTPVSQYVTAPPKESTARSSTWDLPVAPGETDAFYQTKSNWQFFFDRTDVDGRCVYSTESRHGWMLEVIAHKDPAFT